MARDDDEVVDLGAHHLDRFAVLNVFGPANVLTAGFEVVAAFRSPHGTIAFVDPPEVAVVRLLAVRHESRRNPAFREEVRGTMTFEIDLFVDLNTEDDSGLPWTFLDEARNPNAIVPGRYVIVGAGAVSAVAQVVDVADDGVVHVRPWPGPVSAMVHVLKASTC